MSGAMAGRAARARQTMRDGWRVLAAAYRKSRAWLAALTWAQVKSDSRKAYEWSREIVSSQEPERFRSEELSFMSVRRIIGNGRLVILVFFVGFLGWAALAPLDSAVSAPGVVVVETHRKAIQHLEGGIVRAIQVQDGMMVRKGQLLVTLDDTQAFASLRLLEGENDAMTAQEARLASERDGRDAITFPRELVSRQADPQVAAAMRGEESVFRARLETLDKQIAILTDRNKVNGSIIAGLRKEQGAVDSQISLIGRETDSVQLLYNKGLSTLPRLLALQRQAADLTGQRGQLVEKIAQTQLNSGENELQIMNLRNQHLSDVVRDLREVQTKRFDILNKIQAARDVLRRLHIEAPVSGTVVGLEVHTIGSVVRPGDTLMEIVPKKDELEVEAHVRPEDADLIYVGMPAAVNFSAYLRRRIPVISGVVSDVSADRLTDQRTGQPYFNVKITVDRWGLKDYPSARLIPGLPVDVSMNTGSRTALDYFVEPITDVFRKGMREK